MLSIKMACRVMECDETIERETEREKELSSYFLRFHVSEESKVSEEAAYHQKR